MAAVCRVRLLDSRYVMALEITEREREGVTILDIKGRIVSGPETATFRTELERLAAESKNRVILNLREVDFIDSTGLGALVVSASAMKKRNGTVKLLHLNKRNLELMVVTHLSTMFEIFDDEQYALNSFFPDREIKTFDLLSFIKQMKEE
jgi:anti-sigma B factor antagonist